MMFSEPDAKLHSLQLQSKLRSAVEGEAVTVFSQRKAIIVIRITD
jgi:hypothetical protein